MNPLGFPLIDAHTAQLQRERIAAQLATLLPSPLPLPKRLVGRPKRQLDASSILAAAAKVVYSGSVEESDKHASKKARGHYTDWFASPYIHDILAAFRRNNFQARQTVIALQKSTPDGRYDRLNHSTILGWHDSITHQLLPRFQQLLHAGASSSRGAGCNRAKRLRLRRGSNPWHQGTNTAAQPAVPIAARAKVSHCRLICPCDTLPHRDRCLSSSAPHC